MQTKNIFPDREHTSSVNEAWMGRDECYLMWTVPGAAHRRCQLPSDTAVAATQAEELGQAVEVPLSLSSPGNSKTVNNWTTFRNAVRQVLFCYVSCTDNNFGKRWSNTWKWNAKSRKQIRKLLLLVDLPVHNYSKSLPSVWKYRPMIVFT
jgi:hypothetical protein